MTKYNLQIGDKSDNGVVEILDQDRLCYLVKNMSRGSFGIRTISKALVDEFVEYISSYPNANGAEAKEALSGRTNIDKYEYGYNATLVTLANMALKRATKDRLSSSKETKTSLPLQQIFYGAPGTGKSFEIDAITKQYDVMRTTFHPDSDYSTFVGAYKPTMMKVNLRDVSGHLVKEEGTTKPVTEERITYKFVKQAFLKAYLSAWKKYAEAGEGDAKPQFLVIEEINRGNCAQIFGDLFQLLDRQDNGFSSYVIEADADLQREIAEAFAEEGSEYKLPEGEMDLDGVIEDYKGNLASDVQSGRVLLLPCNLYIWATMNTSDQSLFPIDSAFKRRWDWRYVKIANAGKGYKIKCGDEVCDWWTFISAMNEKIAIETSSDDKKLGYFFCKPAKEGESISAERFVSKVMFYLWNDVFKEGNTEDFNVSDDATRTATFEAFYNDDNKVNEANVRKFLAKIVGEDNLTKEDDDAPLQEEFDDPVNNNDN